MKTILRGALIASTVLFFAACSSDEGDPIEPSVVPMAFTCGEIGDLMQTNYTFVDRGPGVDYIIPCTVKILADVKIAPGVTIAFTNEGGFNVRENGSLSAIGTAASPILITSTELTKGDWKGIMFDSDDNKNRLEYVTIQYAGGGSFNSNGDKGAVITWSGAQLAIINCTITDSEDKGINMPYRSGNITIENTTITRCTVPIQGYSEYISGITGGNFLGNDIDAIRVVAQGSNSSGVWTKHNVPYRIFGEFNISGATLTIDPGVIMEFENGGGIDIGENDNSTLIARGTAANPILFTGVNKVPGAWKGLRFMFTESPLNEISFATIEYAGSETGWKNAAIQIWANPALTVKNVVIKDITGCAIKNGTPSSGTSRLIVDNVSAQNTAGENCII